MPRRSSEPPRGSRSPSSSRRREPLELAQDPLPGRLRDELRRSPQQRLRLGLEAEAELVLESDRAQKPQRIVLEDPLRDSAEAARLEVAATAERIDELHAANGPRDCVCGEVPRPEVVLDRAALERSEVDGTARAHRDAPGAVRLREREDGPLYEPAVDPPGELGVRAGDVHVDDVPAQELVTDRAADDPGRAGADGAPDALIHRGSSSPPGGDRG